MTFVATLNREQFVGWLGRTFEPVVKKVHSEQLTDMGGQGEIFLVWDTKPGRESINGARPLISVANSELRSFFAFVGTYVSTYQPFSAFFRVVPFELLSELVVEWPKRENVLPNMFVGAVIAEARLQTGERARRPSNISIQSCLATMSGAAVAALAAGFDRLHLYSILERWLKTRQRLANGDLRVQSQRIAEFWNVVGQVYEKDGPLYRLSSVAESIRPIVRFLAEVMSSPDDSDPETWLGLVQDLPGAHEALRRMRDSREDRVRAMDQVLPSVTAAEKVDLRIREAVLGYLASRIAGGSMSYLDLLDPIETKMPGALMWFGLFASIRADTDVMSAGECLGRRVSRHLEQTKSGIFIPPSADVSFDELQNILAEPKTELKLRTEHQNVISVELFPAVTSVFRLSREVRQESRDMTVPPDAVKELRFLLDRAFRVLEDISGPQERGLFGDRNFRGRRR
jgi:hypothetical protein